MINNEEEIINIVSILSMPQNLCMLRNKTPGNGHRNEFASHISINDTHNNTQEIS